MRYCDAANGKGQGTCIDPHIINILEYLIENGYGLRIQFKYMMDYARRMMHHCWTHETERGERGVDVSCLRKALRMGSSFLHVFRPRQVDQHQLTLSTCDLVGSQHRSIV